MTEKVVKSRRKEPTSARTVKLVDTDWKIWKLRVASRTIEDIAAGLKISTKTVDSSLKRVMGYLIERTVDTAETHRLVMLTQIDAMIAVLFPTARTTPPTVMSLKAMDRMVVLMARKAELLGIDAPKKIDGNLSGVVQVIASADDVAL